MIPLEAAIALRSISSYFMLNNLYKINQRMRIDHDLFLTG